MRKASDLVHPAHIGRAEEGYYAIIEADDGNRLNPGRTYSAISQAITEGATEIDLDASALKVEQE